MRYIISVLCFHSLNFEKFHTALGCKEDLDAGKYPIPAAAIHRQCQTIPHHQAIASTSILVEIAQELAKTHPIKRKPSLKPPKIQIDQTPQFWKRLRRRCHPPTTNSAKRSLTSGYCLHFNSHGNCSRTCKDTSNQAWAFPHTSQNTHQWNIAILEDWGAAACVTTRWSDSRLKKKWSENYEIIFSASALLFLNGLLKCHGSKVSTWGWHQVNWHQE